MENAIGLLIFLFLITLGYFSGRMIESRHYKSIVAREHDFLNLPAVTLKHALDESRDIAKVTLVAGNAVISVDYFKRFLAGLRNFFGGRVSSYESLIDRARREATLRMKAEAQGANIILNLRVQTSSISKGKKGAIGSIEALVYGTAITYKPGVSQKPQAQQISKPGVSQKPQAQQTSPAAQVEATPTSSAETRYKVVFSGELAPEQDLERVKAKVAALYKVPVEKCDYMFTGRPVTIRGDLDYQSAQKYKNAFARAGAICKIQEV